MPGDARLGGPAPPFPPCLASALAGAETSGVRKTRHEVALGAAGLRDPFVVLAALLLVAWVSLFTLERVSTRP